MLKRSQSLNLKIGKDLVCQIEEKVIFKKQLLVTIKFICILVSMRMVTGEIFIDTSKEGELVKALMNNFAIAVSLDFNMEFHWTSL